MIDAAALPAGWRTNWRRIEFVDDLPKTLTGKIRRIELRELELDRDRGCCGRRLVENAEPTSERPRRILRPRAARKLLFVKNAASTPWLSRFGGKTTVASVPKAKPDTRLSRNRETAVFGPTHF